MLKSLSDSKVPAQDTPVFTAASYPEGVPMASPLASVKISVRIYILIAIIALGMGLIFELSMGLYQITRLETRQPIE